MKTITIYLTQEPRIPGYYVPGLYAPGEPCHYMADGVDENGCHYTVYWSGIALGTADEWMLSDEYDAVEWFRPEFIGSTWIDKDSRYAVIDVGGNLLGYWQYKRRDEK